MSAWPGKYVIGLTGNIATGKSVVRKMFEHLGAMGIDADALTHRAIAQGAPGYQAVIDTFGKWVVGSDGQIDRSRLARLVFSDPQALERLEAIVHPLVRQAVDVLIRRSTRRVIVLEAIKLLESPLRKGCDVICVTYAPKEVQLARLMQKRGMTPEVARQRIAAQPPQEEKLAAADVVIRNDGSFEDTWRQVVEAWQKFTPAAPAPAQERIVEVPSTKVVVERGRPQDAADIAGFINQVSHGLRNLKRADIMAAFGEKAYLLLRLNKSLVGVVGWQVENLVARTNEVYLDHSVQVGNAMAEAMKEVEQNSKDLQCEVSLLFLTPHLARQEEVWKNLGYEIRTIKSLGVRAWQEAAQESMPKGTVLLFKQLRKDRVLRPV